MTTFTRQYKDGIDPAGGGAPPLEYRTSTVDGIVIERDVPVKMRDGFTIYIDVFRPDTDEKAAPLIAWSGYGKHSPQRLEHFPADTGVTRGQLSEHVSFESPDPAYWVPAGYAVITVDPRGTWHSEGDATFWGREEAEDYHDLIEWAGTVDWSNGKVGMAGVSYLAIIQWLTAATKPPTWQR